MIARAKLVAGANRTNARERPWGEIRCRVYVGYFFRCFVDARFFDDAGRVFAVQLSARNASPIFSALALSRSIVACW